MAAAEQISPLNQLFQSDREGVGVKSCGGRTGLAQLRHDVRDSEIRQQRSAEDPHDRDVLQPLGPAEVRVRVQPPPRLLVGVLTCTGC